jgi:hypothetical protein
MLQRNTSELVAGLDDAPRSASALKDCAFCAIPSLLFQYPHGRSPGIDPSQLQCCTAK